MNRRRFFKSVGLATLVVAVKPAALLVRPRFRGIKGIRAQLKACERVYDLEGPPLNLLAFLDEQYRIKKQREAEGRGHITEITWYLDPAGIDYVKQLSA